MAQSEIKAGRPFKFTDPNELKIAIQNYFNEQDPHITKMMVETGTDTKGNPIFGMRETMTKQKPYLVVGLARALEVDRGTLKNYSQESHYNDSISPEIRQELIRSVRNALIRVEEYYESELHKSGLATGMKFVLTNNYGWEDKQVVETSDTTADLNKLDDAVEQRENMASNAKHLLHENEPLGQAKELTDESRSAPSQ